MKSFLAPTNHCPACQQRTSRRTTPLLWRPLMWLLGRGYSFRRCTDCGWVGAAPKSGSESRRGGAEQRAIKPPPVELEGFTIDYSDVDEQERATRDARKRLDGG